MNTMTKFVIGLGVLIALFGGGWMYYSDAVPTGGDEGGFVQESESEESAGNETEFAVGERVSVDGTIVCLPHKGDGPHTLECTFGLKSLDGTHYGLRNSNPPLVDTGADVSVTGTFEPAPANEKYDIAGYIEVESLNTLRGS